MTDTGRAGRALLQTLQKAAFLDEGPVSGDFSPERQYAIARLLGKRGDVPENFTSAARELPTYFQNPADFAILSALLDRLEAAAQLGCFPAPAKTTFGTLGLGWFGAETFPVSGTDETVIGFQEGAFTILEVLATAVVRTMEVTDQPTGSRLDTNWPRIERRIAADRSLAVSTATVLNSYAAFGDAWYSRPYPLDDPYQYPLRTLLLAADLFILAHEYAHVCLGHAAQSAAIRIGNISVDAVQRNRQQEFDADQKALDMTMATLSHVSKFDLASSYWGVALVFSGLELVDRALAVYTTGAPTTPDPSPTHPTFAERRVRTDAWLANRGDSEAARSAAILASLVDRIVASLWPEIESRMRVMNRARMAVSRIWRVGSA